MNHHHHHHHRSLRTWRMAIAAGVLALVAACSADTTAPSQDIDRDATAPTRTDGAPAADARRCAVSALESRAERRALCVD